MTTNYNLFEVSFAQNYSICIKSTFDDIENPKYNEELKKFLAADIKNFGDIIDVMPISLEDAEKFYDMTDFDNWPVFGYESKLKDPWFVYEIGDTYHNNNGEDYIIIAMDKSKNKMILAKKSKLGDKTITSYIGAKGIYMHSWSFGHYFMQNFMAACEWFNEVEEDDDSITLKDFMEMYVGPEDSTIYICNMSVYNYYQFRSDSIPPVLEDCKIHNIGIKEFEVKPFDGEVDDCFVTGITLFIDFEANDVNMTYFAQDYGSHEL